jgi:hypothetical protein
MGSSVCRGCMLLGCLTPQRHAGGASLYCASYLCTLTMWVQGQFLQLLNRANDENAVVPALYSFLSLIQKMLPFKSCIANFDAQYLHNIWIESAFNWMWMGFSARLVHPPAQMYLNQGKLRQMKSAGSP